MLEVLEGSAGSGAWEALGVLGFWRFWRFHMKQNLPGSGGEGLEGSEGSEVLAAKDRGSGLQKREVLEVLKVFEVLSSEPSVEHLSRPLHRRNGHTIFFRFF